MTYWENTARSDAKITLSHMAGGETKQKLLAEVQKELAKSGSGNPAFLKTYLAELEKNAAALPDLKFVEDQISTGFSVDNLTQIAKDNVGTEVYKDWQYGMQDVMKASNAYCADVTSNLLKEAGVKIDGATGTVNLHDQLVAAGGSEQYGLSNGQAGDAVVFRDRNGVIQHTGVLVNDGGKLLCYHNELVGGKNILVAEPLEQVCKKFGYSPDGSSVIHLNGLINPTGADTALGQSDTSTVKPVAAQSPSNYWQKTAVDEARSTFSKMQSGEKDDALIADVQKMLAKVASDHPDFEKNYFDELTKLAGTNQILLDQISAAKTAVDKPFSVDRLTKIAQSNFDKQPYQDWQYGMEGVMAQNNTYCAAVTSNLLKEAGVKIDGASGTVKLHDQLIAAGGVEVFGLSQGKAGDAVVFRDQSGVIQHTGVLVMENGQLVCYHNKTVGGVNKLVREPLTQICQEDGFSMDGSSVIHLDAPQ